MKGAIIAVIAILAVASLAVQQGQAVNCGQVDARAGPVHPFPHHRQRRPVTSLLCGSEDGERLAQTTADKRAACSCVKAAAGHYDLKDAAAQSLPSKCDVELDIPVSRTVDCDK